MNQNEWHSTSELPAALPASVFVSDGLTERQVDLSGSGGRNALALMVRLSKKGDFPLKMLYWRPAT